MSETMFKSFCSTEIEFSDIASFKKALVNLTQSKPTAFIMRKSAAERWGFDKVILSIENNSFVWINDFDPNPSPDDIINALAQLSSVSVEQFITIGGGSAIDLTKSIKAFYKKNTLDYDEIITLIANKEYIVNDIPIIALPTTSGTGAEMTQWGTVWDKKNNVKYSVDATFLKPEKAVIISEFTLNSPAEITLTTGLDAMTQAIEAYWSKHTTPLVQQIATRAIQLIRDNLRQAIDSPDEVTYRNNMALGSVLTGIAFSHTRTTACHALSYPLTMEFGIPHGYAVAMTLPKVAELNKGHFPNDEQLFNLFEDYTGISGWLNYVTRDLTNLTLSNYSVTQKDIKELVNSKINIDRLKNNPVNLSHSNIINMFKSL